MFSYLAQIHVEVIQNSRGEYLVEESKLHISRSLVTICAVNREDRLCSL